MCAMHRSKFLDNLNLIYIDKNIIAAFNINHAIPKPNNVKPVRPENNKLNKTINATDIHTTNTLL